MDLSTRNNSEIKIQPNGTKTWRINGQLHRIDGPAVIWANGSEEWYIDGKRHRDDGPAIILSNGYQEWWQHSQIHRLDGPAIIHRDGTEEWWLNDVKYRNITAWARVVKSNYKVTDAMLVGILLRY